VLFTVWGQAYPICSGGRTSAAVEVDTSVRLYVVHYGSCNQVRLAGSATTLTRAGSLVHGAHALLVLTFRR
jgi:hypothetical protein